MLNNLFKKYSDDAFEEIEVDSHHKNQLQKHLFPQKEEKRPLWSWTKAIFTAPIVAAFAIIFFLSSNQETVKQVLLPQEALAQALENTFNLDTLGTNLGLPTDGRFYHRTITYDSNYLDGLGPNTETTDFWTDGVSLRRDSLMISDDSKFRDFQSFLTNPEQDVNCSLVLYKECGSLAESNKDEISKFTSGDAVFHPVDKENLVADFSIEKGENTKGSIYWITWSTKSPMESALIQHGSDMYSGEMVGVNNVEDGYYTNVLKEGKYWHKVAMVLDTSFIADKKFFQILNNVSSHVQENSPNLSKIEYSMVYTINSKDLKISSATSEELIEEIKKSNAPTNVMQELFYTSFISTMFFLNKENFTDPVFTKSIEKHGEDVFQLRYALPENPSKDSIFIDLFIDETQTHFLGYTLIRNDKEAESVWIEDEILPDSEKLGLFDQAAWEQSIVGEDKAKEPERQKWLEIEKNQNQNEILEIEPINLRNIQ